MNRKDHWDAVHTTKAHDAVSWYQVHPELSLRLIEQAGLGKGDAIIDIGGGASTLVDHLLDMRYSRIAVLDISNAALSQARKRLGVRAPLVEWIVADVTAFAPPHLLVLWHDRAVFHFLTNPSDRRRYVAALKRALAPTGHLVMATFAVNGPQTCSGLDVCRYDADSIRRAMGEDFQLLEHLDETHRTPSGAAQAFTYFRFQRRGQ